jgi:hypothetical protein
VYQQRQHKKEKACPSVRLPLVPLDDIRPFQFQHETKQKVTLRCSLKLISPGVKDAVDGNTNIHVSASCQRKQNKTRVKQGVYIFDQDSILGGEFLA